MQNAKRYSVLPRLRRIFPGKFRRGLHEPRKIRQVPPVLRCIRAHRKIFDAADTPRSFRRMTKIARCIRAFQKIFDAPDTPRTFRRVTKIARCIRALRAWEKQPVLFLRPAVWLLVLRFFSPLVLQSTVSDCEQKCSDFRIDKLHNMGHHHVDAMLMRC